MVATLERMRAEHPTLARALASAHGYAVFPSVAKATVGLGVAYGRGEVFKKGARVGRATLVQLTLGAQIGGQTFDQVVVFADEAALSRFIRGKPALAARASAVLVKAASGIARASAGTRVFVQPTGGFMLEAAVGGQRVVFRKLVPKARPAAPPTKPDRPEEPSPAASTTKSARQDRAPTEPQVPEVPRTPAPQPPGPPSPVVLFDGSARHMDAWRAVGEGKFRFGRVIVIEPGSDWGLLYYGGRTFEDFTLDLEFRLDRLDDRAGVCVRCRDPAHPTNGHNPARVAAKSGLEVMIGEQVRDDGEPRRRTGAFGDLNETSRQQQFSPGPVLRVREWNRLHLLVRGDDYRVSINERETTRLHFHDAHRGLPPSRDERSGYVGIKADKGRVAFRNVRLEEAPRNE